MSNRDGIESAFDAAVNERAEALIALPDALFFNNRPTIIGQAARKHLPAMYWARQFADEGGLIAYGGNRADSIRRAASYVDKILKGEKPADLPVEQSSQFELVVNLGAARELGLTIPESVLIEADTIHE